MISRVKHLKVFIKDPDKKPFLKIFIELIHFTWIKKTLPTDYFRKFLYRKDVIDYKNYLSLKEYYAIIKSPKIVIPEIETLVNNKLAFAIYAERNKLPTPKLISYNLKNSFFFKNNLTTVSSIENLILFFETVFKSSKKNKLFLKLIDSQGGMGHILLKKETFHKQIELHGDIILNQSFIHQEVVNQHPSINKIFSNSINTLRIDTYVDESQKVHILSALMRFGVGESYTDNVSTGGFSVSVNTITGKLQGIGRQEASKGGNVFLKHPDTNIVLENYSIPFVTKACDLSKLASENLPCGIIGWDIAITEKGAVIIEGNAGPSLHITDVAYGGYCKHPLIKTILRKVKK